MNTENYLRAAGWLPVFAILCLSSSCFVSPGRECGEGTSIRDGECRGELRCGEGTELRDQRCVPVAAGLPCAAGTVLNRDTAECVPLEDACPPTTVFDVETGGCVPEDSIRCGEATVATNGVCVPACEGPFQMQNENLSGCVLASRVQVVHASPDPALATVDFYGGANLLETEEGDLVGNNLPFRQATPFVKVALGAPFRLSAANSKSSDDFLLEIPADMLPVSRYLVVIRPSADGTSTELVAFRGLLEDLSESPGTRFRFANASVGASLSVGRQERYGEAAAEELFSNVAVDVLPPYVEVPSGTRAFDVYEAGGGPPLASVQTSSGDLIPAAMGFTADDVGVLVALGVQRPTAGQTALDFIWVMGDGRVGPADRAARVQLVHGSFEAGTGVDVYLSASEDSEFGEPITADLLYQEATPFQSFAAGVPGVVRLVPNISPPTPGNVVSSTPVDFGFGQTARVVALGGSADSPLTVNVVQSSEQAANPATIDIQMFHASTTAPSPVDVYLSSALSGVSITGAPDVAGLTFGVATPAVEGRAFEDTFVSLSEDGASSLVDFNVGFAPAFELESDGGSFFAVVTGTAETLNLAVVAPSGRVDVN